MHRLIRRSLVAMLPGSDTLPGVADVGLDDWIRRFRTEPNAHFRYGLYAGAVLYAVGPVLTLGLPVPAFALGRRLEDRHARRMAAHRLYLVRQAAVILKTAAGLAWGADPAVREALGCRPYDEERPGFRGDAP